jgi:hypothetical protein
MSPSKWADPESPIDYSLWKALTDKPKRIPLSWFTLCMVSPDMERRQDALGGHYVPMVKLFANPAAADNIEHREKTPLPMGATIVKEKWLRKSGGGFDAQIDDSGPGEYGAMIKREAGYDPEHGDWEYVFVTRSTPLKVERGKLESCRECHSRARETDYLFLPDPDADNYPDQ